MMSGLPAMPLAFSNWFARLPRHFEATAVRAALAFAARSSCAGVNAFLGRTVCAFFFLLAFAFFDFLFFFF